MMILKELYQNKYLYLLIMVVLLLTITVLDSFEFNSLVIRVLLFTFYVLLILRYHFLNYSLVFIIFIGLICLTSVFYEEFIVLLSEFNNKAIIENYLLYRVADITMGLILVLFIWSFLSAQKIKANNTHEAIDKQ